MRDGWEYKKLGEVAQVVSGATPKTNVDEFWGEGHYWVTPAELNDSIVYVERTERQITDFALLKTKLQLLPKGTVLLSSRAPIGKVAICGVDMYCNQGFKNCICSDAIYNKYLYYFLKCKKEYLNSLGRGATFKEISKSIVEKVVIHFPPIQEQKDIVAELDQINDLIRLKKEQLKEYDNLAQSIFYDMFGDPVENEKGWEVKKFGELVELKNGLNFTPTEDGNKIRVIGVADFKDNSVITGIDTIGFKNIKEEVSQDYYLKDGDILIVRSNGSKELVGRNLIVYTNGEMITYSGFCIRCRIKDLSIVSSVYLNAFLSKREIRMLLRQEGRGANISNINQKILSSQRVPLPPLPLQQEFSSRIEQIEKLKAEVQKTITDLETLLASRMQYWFE